MKVDETYRRNVKNKEPEAVNSASFSGEMASRKSFRIFIKFKHVYDNLKATDLVYFLS
jgi:hypothetical protein